MLYTSDSDSNSESVASENQPLVAGVRAFCSNFFCCKFSLPKGPLLFGCTISMLIDQHHYFFVTQKRIHNEIVLWIKVYLLSYLCFCHSDLLILKNIISAFLYSSKVTTCNILNRQMRGSRSRKTHQHLSFSKAFPIRPSMNSCRTLVFSQ